ncbi:CBS domain-containing protein [Actinomadura scrupuli]|uniref:CBS domain-containing protein n=1 Tax=Actinomadura scrupuli TaxID=559629 RepID=UPI003D9826DC
MTSSTGTRSGRPLEERTVAEVMAHDLLTIAADDSMLMAWEVMSRARYHHLPVVTDDGRLLGVLDTETLSSHWQEGPDRNRRPVRSLLTDRRCVSMRPTDRVSLAAKIMTRERVDVIAVTDARAGLLGLVTARGLVAALGGAEQPDQGASPNTPSLYRIEPVLPPAGHQAGAPAHSVVPPD